MTVRVVTPPAQMVSTADAKLHLRVDHSEDDARIASLIAAATAELEAATQRRFMEQELEWVRPHWSYPMRLPVAPVASVDGITYADEIEGGTVLATTEYRVAPSGEGTIITATDGTVWPVLDPDAEERVVIAFTAGEEAAPTSAVVACKLLVEYYYERREWPLAPSGLPTCVEGLIAPLRWN